MKRTDTITKIIALVFSLAIALYLGAYLVNSMRDPYQTSLAVKFTVDETMEVSGLVIREEEILTSDFSLVDIVCGEGEKVGRGQAVAKVYSSEGALERVSRIRALQLQIQQLESAASSTGDKSISAHVANLAYAVSRRDLKDLESLSLAVQTRIFDSFSKADINSTLAAARAELLSLESTSGGSAVSIPAPEGGVFSRLPDGFENLRPGDWEEMSVESFSSLLTEERSSTGIGKLIYGMRWYYVTEMPAADAKLFKQGMAAGNRYSFQFEQHQNLKLSLETAYVGSEEAGRCIVVFSCEQGLSDTTDMRQVKASILHQSNTGIRIPRKALRVDAEGRTHVFTLTGIQEELKYVNILAEFEDFYLIEIESADSALHEGDEIIVGGRDLQDGKVVR